LASRARAVWLGQAWFDLDGNAIGSFNRAYRIGPAILALGGRPISRGDIQDGALFSLTPVNVQGERLI